MVKSILTVAMVTILGLSSLAWSAEETKEAEPEKKIKWSEKVELRFHHGSGYDGEALNIDHSGVELGFGTLRWKNSLQPETLRLPEGAKSRFYRLTFEGSFIPSLLRDRTEEQVWEETKKTIDHAYATNPLLQGAPAAVVDTLKQGTYAEYREKIKENMDDLVHETTFHEVSVTWGVVSADKKTVYFVKVGKYKVEAGPGLNQNGQSRLEEITGNNLVQRGQTGNSSALGANLGVIHVNDSGIRMRGDLNVVASRGSAFVNGRDRVARVMNGSDEEHDWYSIDSVHARFLIQKGELEAYAAIASYDGELAFSAGVVVPVTNDLTLFFDYAIGERDIFEQAASTTMVYHFSKLREFRQWLDVSWYISYQRREGYKDAFSNIVSDADVFESGLHFKNPLPWGRKFQERHGIESYLRAGAFHEDRKQDENNSGVRATVGFSY